MEQIINKVEFADFDDDRTTVSVTATANDKTVVFHVQTLDGEYRPSMGCWMFTNDDGEDLIFEDYPDFDFDEIISNAEELAESTANGEENPDYINQYSTPYTHRFLIDNDEANEVE